MAFLGTKGVPANMPLLKKAKQLGNEYSDNYCKQSIARQLHRQRMDLIKMVDEEIYETQRQLVSLRAQLARSRATTKQKVLAVPQETAPTLMVPDDHHSHSHNPAIQVPPRKKPANNEDKSIDSAISSCASSEHTESPVQTAIKQVRNDSPDDNSHQTAAVHSSEERYLAKLKKIFQNRDGREQVKSTQLRMPHQQDSSSGPDQFTQLFVDDIVEKLCHKLQRIGQPLQAEKELKSVAIETTFGPFTENPEVESDSDTCVSSDADKESVSADSVLEEREVEEAISDGTIYLHLPAKSQVAKTKHQRRAIKEVSFFNTNDLTRYRDIEVKEKEAPLVKIDLLRNSLSVNDQQQAFGGFDLNFSDIAGACNTSMFKTLSEVPSNCSTPKGGLEKSRNVSSRSLASFSMAQEFSDLQRSHIDFTLNTSTELSALDNDKFWKDVFHAAGINDP